MKLGFVCTNYNNSGFTRSAIESLRAGPRWQDVRVVVVDNQSNARDIEGLRSIERDFPEVDIVFHGRNAGYFPGLNVGIARLRAAHPDVLHMVVGNNDLTFPAEFVDSVQQYREILDQWAVVAPDLIALDGMHQNPHVLYSISRARRLVWDLYYASYLLAGLIRRAARVTRGLTSRAENQADQQLYRKAGPVEQGYGACYLIGPCFFRHFRQFYAPTFLMQEEFFLSEQLKLIGQQTWYDPRFVVHHHAHASMGTLSSRRHWSISRDSHQVYKRYLALPLSEQRRLVAEGSGASA